MTLEDRIRGAFTNFNEGGLLAAQGFWHPDVEYHEAFDFPGASTYRGRDAVRARFEEYLEVLGDTEASLERVVAKEDRAAWLVRYAGRTAEGLPHDHTWGYVGRFDDGMLIECQAHYEADQALAAFDAQG